MSFPKIQRGCSCRARTKVSTMPNILKRVRLVAKFSLTGKLKRRSLSSKVCRCLCAFRQLRRKLRYRMIKHAKSRRKIKYILNNLRSDDLEEIKKCIGDNWFSVVLKSIMRSEVNIGVSKTSGKPVLCYGAFEDENRSARVFLLATSEIDNKKISFLRNAKKEIAEIEKKYTLLYNFISTGNFKMYKLLELLGFVVTDISPIAGVKFFYKQILKGGVGCEKKQCE